VYTRGVEKRLIVRDEADNRRLVAGVGDVVRDRGWVCLAFCVMPNHLHLLVRTPDPDLDVGMQLLLGRYARRFNDRHGRVGPLFAGRYGSKLVEHDDYLVWLLRYVARNPVRARLCEAPGDWPWSSYSTVVGGRPHWDFVRSEEVLDTMAAQRPTASTSRTLRARPTIWPRSCVTVATPSSSSRTTFSTLGGDHRRDPRRAPEHRREAAAAGASARRGPRRRGLTPLSRCDVGV
jgi:REP element-mobilizing transposase RayT